MPDYWLDADSLIRPHREAYQFDMVRPFWDFLESKARDGIIASPEIVLDKELISNSKNTDPLQEWGKGLKGILFLPIEDQIQVCYSQVVDYVQNCGKYKQQWVASFLDGADPWVVAYPMAKGGNIVTFEKPQPSAKRPKIPDIADHFGLRPLTLYEMLKELGFRL